MDGLLSQYMCGCTRKSINTNDQKLSFFSVLHTAPFFLLSRFISSYIPLTLSHTLLTSFIARNKLLIKFHENLISSYILLTLAHTLLTIFINWGKQVVDQKFHESLISTYILLTLSHTLVQCTMYNCKTWATRMNPFTAKDKFD